MDQSRLGEALFRLEHRHNDGTWEALEPRPAAHDPSALDPETSWKDGDVYACPSCEQQVRVRRPEGGTGPG